MKTKEFNINGFVNVAAGGYFDVEIVQADTFRVSISADDFAHILVEKANDTLIIRYRGIDCFAIFHSQPQARIAMPSLAKLVLSGASKGKMQGFNSTNNLELTLSGASHLEAFNISTGSLGIKLEGASGLTGDIKASGDAKFEVAGAGKLDLKGAANKIILQSSGASKVALDKFPAQNADVEISGASTCTVNLNGKLNADVTGASSLHWSGTPLMGDIQISGASKLCRN